MIPLLWTAQSPSVLALPLTSLGALVLQAGLEAAQAEQSSPGVLRILGVGLLIVAPIYLFLAFFVRIVREAYGFVEVPQDDGPPLRVCHGCDNTILDPKYVHCPYCGNDLPEVAWSADTDESAEGEESVLPQPEAEPPQPSGGEDARPAGEAT